MSFFNDIIYDLGLNNLLSNNYEKITFCFMLCFGIAIMQQR